ncbi:response regulator [Pseudanabaena sp. FACHB-2040]|uniref:response regulator n=1 Tax=Pseudanabaena sp. FACHB-2040 TaxID=2692859 RepID=UPI001688E286|nr:response regulator [Pseudanabaena sp. FACHB-2040]MBD2258580.1 response regulator [Pseudanabaena sp. FACHB-2040]
MEPLPPSLIPSQNRILLVEDDYANRMFFSEYLRYCGYQVLALSEGLNLFLHLKEFRPHVLVLDLCLPEIDGSTLIQQIRSDGDWQHLPIIVVSGYAFDADREKAEALGIQAYLVKPIRLQELVQSVARYCAL